jgi:Bacterial signalling protein N terminal repeat
MIGVAFFYRRVRGKETLLAGGLITGLGVAAMHYLGMAAMRMPGRPARQRRQIPVPLARLAPRMFRLLRPELA